MQKFKVCVSCCNYTKKPDVKGMSWQTVDADLDDLFTYSLGGYSLTGYYGFEGKYRKGRTKDNWLSSPFVYVDLDDVVVSWDELLDTLVEGENELLKPSYMYSTFSHQQEGKGNRYRLVYVFDREITNADLYRKIATYYDERINATIGIQADTCNKTVNQLMHGTGKGALYHKGEVKNLSTISQEVGDFTCCNVQKNTPSKAKAKAKAEEGEDTFILSDDFFNDLNSMDRRQLMAKYASIYPYQTTSNVEYNTNGYADLRGSEYYEVSSKWWWNTDKGTYEVNKVSNGHRAISLFHDALGFVHCIPSITPEWLVMCLVSEVYYHYDNSDKEFTNAKIINTARTVWNNRERYTYSTTDKSFKIDKSYWREQGVKPQRAVAMVRKNLKDDDLGANIDLSLSIEKNMEALKNMGIKVKKERFMQFLEENDIVLRSDKEIRNELVIKYHNKNPNLTCREIAEAVSAEGYKVSYASVTRILNIL